MRETVDSLPRQALVGQVELVSNVESVAAP